MEGAGSIAPGSPGVQPGPTPRTQLRWSAARLSTARTRDTNRSGWWYWIVLVPCIGGLWYLILMLLPSTPGQNQYG